VLDPAMPPDQIDLRDSQTGELKGRITGI
jgi:hypothetical protein